MGARFLTSTAERTSTAASYVLTGDSSESAIWAFLKSMILAG